MSKFFKALSCVFTAGCAAPLIRYRVAATTEHMRILRARPYKLVIDVGANKGQFSVAVRAVHKAVRLIAFEPLPAPAARYKRVFQRHPNVRLHQFAIGPQKGVVPIYRSQREDSSSLLPITAKQERLFPGTSLASVEQIKVAPLSDFVRPQDIPVESMLKLDVQGFELQALRGCEDLVDRFASVYVECSFVELYKDQALASEVISWLALKGFGLVGIYNVAYGPGGLAVQADFLFERR